METTETLYTDIWAMIDDMKKHAAENGGAIIQKDQPYKLRLGYLCETTGKTWLISLVQMKRSMENRPDEADALKRLFTASDGKEMLLQQINRK